MGNLKMTERNSPLTSIDCSFRHYVEKRQNREEMHMDGNSIPDYAFGLDYELRRKLDSIPHLYNIAKKVTATTVSRYMQEYNRSALAVGPNQLPEVYQIGCDCAQTLGIGIPNIFIQSSAELNAYTYACEDIEPIIIINSALYERAKPEILRAVIGHECGHIQNAHSMYQMIGVYFATGSIGALSSVPGLSQLMGLLTVGTQIALNSWSRAAEVTADRASVICSSKEDAVRTMLFLMYGGVRNVDADSISLDAVQEQLELQMSNIAKYGEILDSTHPATARRIAAIQAFDDCETLYAWRPELKEPGKNYHSKAETEELCRNVISVTRQG